jgi:hypothetical protein
MLNDLNNLVAGAPVAEPGTFTPHPLGEFPGKVVNVSGRKVKTHDRGEVPVYEIEAQTSHGMARYSIWGYVQADVAEIMQGGKAREQFNKTIGRVKRLYVDLGVWSGDDALGTVLWAGEGRSILGDMSRLVGKDCWVVCRPSQKDPNDAGKRVVFLNAPRPGQSAQPVSSTASVANLPGVGPTASNGALPPPTMATPPSQPPAVSPSLDDIPF